MKVTKLRSYEVTKLRSYDVMRCDQIYKAYLYLTYNIHNIEKKINCQ
jgi:hypothetical protein